MKMLCPRKNGKSTLCINSDIMKLDEHIEKHKDLAEEIWYYNLTSEDFFHKGGKIHIDWSLEMGRKNEH